MSKSRYNKKRSRKNKRSRKTGGVYKPASSKKYIFILFMFFIIMLALYYIVPDSITFTIGIDEYKKDEIKEIVREVLQEENNTDTTQNSVITEPGENVEEQNTQQEQQVEQTTKVEVTSRGAEPRQDDSVTLTDYRITSYHPGDNCLSGTKTGSGKTINDFSTIQIGGKDVYTYKGKIVVATATEELLESGYNVKGGGTRQEGKHYFNYYDELKINIDGTYYNAIVLDSCGAAMWTGEYRIDLYVPGASDVINRSNVTVKI